MKRYLFTLLLLACAGACNRNAVPSETALDNTSEEQAYGSESSVADNDGVADGHANDMAAPEHRPSDEIASTGDGLPDNSARTNDNARTTPAPGAGGLAPADSTTTAKGTDTVRTSDGVARKPDNTGVNERDRSGSTLTPMDQSEKESDIKITQDIRSSIVGNDALSFSSKNVKIITRDGKVTLRGSVPSARERSLIADAAKSRAGVTGVDNQLEVSNK